MRALFCLLAFAACGGSDSKGCPASYARVGGTCVPTWDAEPEPDAGHDAGPLVCELPEADCGEAACVDLASAFDHCGACDFACDDATASVCEGGTCHCGDTGLPCAGDVSDRCCGGACVDMMSDDANCGACGNVCGADAPDCVLRACVCGASGRACDGTIADTCCPGALGSVCTDTTADAANCGGCGTTCADPEAPACVDGACVCGIDGRTCAGTPDDSCCDTGGVFGCTDTRSNPLHCGGCGADCAADVGTSCIDGDCFCGNLGLGCDGTIRSTCCGEGTGADLCANLLTDEANCGACDRLCEAPESSYCRNGACVCGIPSDPGIEPAACAAGEECCGIGVAAVCVPAGTC